MEERLKAYGVRAGFAEDCVGDVIEIVDGCSVTHRNARPGRVFWAAATSRLRMTLATAAMEAGVAFAPALLRIVRATLSRS
jgi:hypothetical protein